MARHLRLTSGGGGGAAEPGRIALLYALFAVAATLANLAAQRAALALHAGPGALPLAIAAGTAAGLVVKYLLDKRWIFGDRSAGLAAHGRRFTLYTATGAATTAVFWGFEYAFWRLGDGDPVLREAGAVIGLSIGYVAKYRLDRRFVFRPAPSGAGGRAMAGASAPPPRQGRVPT